MSDTISHWRNASEHENKTLDPGACCPESSGGCVSSHMGPSRPQRAGVCGGPSQAGAPPTKQQSRCLVCWKPSKSQPARFKNNPPTCDTWRESGGTD